MYIVKGINIDGFWKRVEVRSKDECWLWTGNKRPDGYGLFYDRRDGKLRRASRISYEINKGLITKNLFVLHKCDNPPCVNPNHLILGTNKDNIDDRCRKGRTRTGHCYGEDHKRSKLKNDQVLTIYDSDISHRKLAKQYKVGKYVIFLIKHRRLWKKLLNEFRPL